LREQILTIHVMGKQLKGAKPSAAMPRSMSQMTLSAAEFSAYKNKAEELEAKIVRQLDRFYGSVLNFDKFLEQA